MARNTTKGRRGPVRNRIQWFNAKISRWVKCDARTGRVLAVKADAKSWKGVRKVKTGGGDAF